VRSKGKEPTTSGKNNIEKRKRQTDKETAAAIFFFMNPLDVSSARHGAARERAPLPIRDSLVIDLSLDDDHSGSNNSNVGIEPIVGPLTNGLPDNDRAHAPRKVAARVAAHHDNDEIDTDEDDDDDQDDDEDDDDDEDSDDPDDNGSDLDDFIVSDDDGDKDSHDSESEAEFVPRDRDGDNESDDDDNDHIRGDAMTLSTHATSDDTSTIVLTSDDDDSDDDNNANNGQGKRRRSEDDDAAACVGTPEKVARNLCPAKRPHLDQSEVSAIDPSNIVDGKRRRQTTRRYMDRHFMEFMVRDVPADQIAAVFDDDDEYFRSGISPTDSSESDDAIDIDNEDTDEGGGGINMRVDDANDDLDSSDYEALDALSSSSLSTHDQVRRRRLYRGSASIGSRRSASSPSGPSPGTPSAEVDTASADLSRPPSTVAALLRSLAAQPGGIRPSVASPRSTPPLRAQSHP
jgi:hypothetical protein